MAAHAVLHLLYSRFWHKVLFDIGVVSTPEPFMKLVPRALCWAKTIRRCPNHAQRGQSRIEMIGNSVQMQYGSMKCSWDHSKR